MRRKSEQGFTILEMSIAIAIFGLLMLYVSQLMNSQIRLLNNVTRQNELEKQARMGMMHILDEIRMHKATYYEVASNKVYYDPPNENIDHCIIDINPNLSVPDDQLPRGIYYDANNKSLMLGEWNASASTYNKYLMAGMVKSVAFEEVTDNGVTNPNLIKVTIVTEDPQTLDSYQLISWSRLY